MTAMRASPWSAACVAGIFAALLITSFSAEVLGLREDEPHHPAISRRLQQVPTCSTSPGQYLRGGKCVNCPVSDLGPTLSTRGATSEDACFCPPKGSSYYLSGTGCVPCNPTTTTNVSPDGKTCTCKPNYISFDPGFGSCIGNCGTNGMYWVSGPADCDYCPGPANASTTPAYAKSVEDCYSKKGGSGYRYWREWISCDNRTTTGVSTGEARCVCRPSYGPEFAVLEGRCRDPPCKMIGEYRNTAGICTYCRGTPGVDVFTNPQQDAWNDEGACYATRNGQYYYKPGIGPTLCDPVSTTGSRDGTTCDCRAGLIPVGAHIVSFCLPLAICKVGQYSINILGAAGEVCRDCKGVPGTDVFSSARWSYIYEDDCYAVPGGTLYYKPGVGPTPCNPVSTTGTSADGKKCICKSPYRTFDRQTNDCTPTCKGMIGVDVFIETYGTEDDCYAYPGGKLYYKPGFGPTPCDPVSTTGISANGQWCKCKPAGFQDWSAEDGACRPYCKTGQYQGPNGSPAYRKCFNCGGQPGIDVFTRRVSIGKYSSVQFETSCFATPGGKSYYKQGVGPTPCDPFTTTGISADGRSCTCLAGFKNWDSSTGACFPNVACTTAVTGATYYDGARCVSCGSSTASTGGYGPGACSCTIPGYYYSTAAPLGCKACPTSTTSMDGRSCTCPAGFANFDRKTGKCGGACPPTAYFSIPAGACVPCATAGSVDATSVPTTPAGATSQSACACNATTKYPAAKRLYYKLDVGCVPCPGAPTTGVPSPDGMNCTCTWSTPKLFFDRGAPAATACCTPAGAKCGTQLGASIQPACCPGSTCRATPTPTSPKACVP